MAMIEGAVDLTIQSNSTAVKGKILFGTSVYNEVNNRMGIGTDSPSVELEVVGDIKAETITLTNGKSAGYVLTSDADGVGSWEDPSTLVGPAGPEGPAGANGTNGAAIAATKQMAAADIIGMNAAPVVVVAAPGAGKALVFLGLSATVSRTEVAFTGGGAVSVKYDGGSDVTATIASTVITGASGQSFTVRTPADLSDVGLAGIEDKALVITNADAPFADGTGTAELTVLYATVDV